MLVRLDRLLTARNLLLRTLPFLLVAFATLMAAHPLQRLAAEWQLQRHPIVLVTLAAPLAGLALLRTARRPAHWLSRLLPLLLTGSLVANVVLFVAADPSERVSTFTVRPDARLSSLDPMPGWRNHWNSYRLYTTLHAVVRGATIHAPAPPSNATHPQFEGWFHPHYLRYISESAERRDRTYPAELSFADTLWLLARSQPALEDYATKIRWRIVDAEAAAATQPSSGSAPTPATDGAGPKARAEDYYVLIGLGQHFLAPASVVARLQPP